MGPLASDPSLTTDSTDGALSLDTRDRATAGGNAPAAIDLADSASAPHVGAPAVIVSTTGGEPVAGEITLWSAGELVATSRILVGAESARDLAGERVFARVRGKDAMIVVQAQVQLVAGRPDEIELVGVAGLAVESRRNTVRASLRRPVLLMPDVAPTLGSQTLDLSAGGCRIEIPAGTFLAPGMRLQTVVTDTDGATLWLRSEVVRVDVERGEAALKFLDIANADAFRIDREVLAWHAGYLSA